MVLVYTSVPWVSYTIHSTLGFGVYLFGAPGTRQTATTRHRSGGSTPKKSGLGGYGGGRLRTLCLVPLQLLHVGDSYAGSVVLKVVLVL